MTHLNATTRAASSHLTPMQLAKLTVLARDGRPGPLEWIERLQYHADDPQYRATRYQHQTSKDSVTIFPDGEVFVAIASPMPGRPSAYDHNSYSNLYVAAFGQAGYR